MGNEEIKEAQENRMEKLFSLLSPAGNPYGDSFADWDRYRPSKQPITLEMATGILQGGDLQAKINLSQSFFELDNIYRRTLAHHATLPLYAGLIVPSVEKWSEAEKKRYDAVLDFMEEINVKTWVSEIVLKVLVSGAFYGIVSEYSKKEFKYIELPIKYCRSEYKDLNGQDIIEFDVSYFDTIRSEETRRAVLNSYPKDIQRYYKKHAQGKSKLHSWYPLSNEYAFYFDLFSRVPFFAHVIPTIINYHNAVERENLRDDEEIKKILVQKVPILTSGDKAGQLVFEPPEAASMHQGAVDMVGKRNQNLSIWTTYGEISAIDSKGTSENTLTTRLDKHKDAIYTEFGTSSLVFSPKGNIANATSLENDLSFIMPLVHEIAKFFTKLINKSFNLRKGYEYLFLPVSYFNQKDYLKQSQVLASSGYSLIIPAIVQGLGQRSFVKLKDLENDILSLVDKLIPPSTSYTQSGKGDKANEGGRPNLPDDEKTEKTIVNLGGGEGGDDG